MEVIPTSFSDFKTYRSVQLPFETPRAHFFGACGRSGRKNTGFVFSVWKLCGRPVCVRLGDLSDGVYQLTLSNSDRTETHRLVKASNW